MNLLGENVDETLSLDKIRGVLIRLEDTIIFCGQYVYAVILVLMDRRSAH